MYRYRLYDIIKEIDEGIETIKPLLSGETRQIAECQIIGLEEAKKIVEKHMKQTDVTQVGKVKRIKVFPAPNVEMRIFVSPQMERDWRKCEKMLREEYRTRGCSTCSWRNSRLIESEELTAVCGMVRKEMLNNENVGLPCGEK